MDSQTNFTNPSVAEASSERHYPLREGARASSPGVSGSLMPETPATQRPRGDDTRRFAADGGDRDPAGFAAQARATRPPTEPEAREMRRRERETGVEFWLKDTGLAARVRDLPFTDRTMLRGIPADMRVSVGQALSEARRLIGTTVDIAASLNLLQSNVEIINATCLTGFIWPRLVRTEAERDEMLSRDSSMQRADVWLVDSLSDNEKEDYFNFVFRLRTDGAKEDAARLATFPGAGVAEAGMGNARDALRQDAV